MTQGELKRLIASAIRDAVVNAGAPIGPKRDRAVEAATSKLAGALVALSSEVQPVGSERSDEGNLPPDEPILPLPHPDTSRHAAWLIERHDLGETRYYTTTPKGHGWAVDPNVADKFPTEEAARAACQGGDKDGPLKVTEHIWLALAQPDPLTETSGRVDGSSVADSAGAGPDGPGACDAQCQSEGGAS